MSILKGLLIINWNRDRWLVTRFVVFQSAIPPLYPSNDVFELWEESHDEGIEEGEDVML